MAAAKTAVNPPMMATVFIAAGTIVGEFLGASDALTPTGALA